jgi:hypothetical protein
MLHVGPATSTRNFEIGGIGVGSGVAFCFVLFLFYFIFLFEKARASAYTLYLMPRAAS